ncbi:Uncharacterised protein [Salmonella enterica subsp. enterica serovar Bovismorbificans]|nr:Uncharacterised protein [Salmonella enterica subsp. enterica serovar Bovismorbificans]
MLGGDVVLCQRLKNNRSQPCQLEHALDVLHTVAQQVPDLRGCFTFFSQGAESGDLLGRVHGAVSAVFGKGDSPCQFTRHRFIRNPLVIRVYLPFFNQQTDRFCPSPAANHFQPTIVTFHHHDVMDLPDCVDTVGIPPDFFLSMRNDAAVQFPDKQAGPGGVTDGGVVQCGNQNV